MTQQRTISVAALAALLLAGTVLASFFHRPGSGAGPDARQAVLSVTKSVHDLGATTLRESWEIPFPVRNAGTRRLIINELDGECACDDRVGRTFVIPPGGTVFVPVKIDARSSLGPVESVAYFSTNDPLHPRFHLTVRANVEGAKVSSPVGEARTSHVQKGRG